LDENQALKDITVQAVEAASAPCIYALPRCSDCNTVRHIQTWCSNCSNSWFCK